MLRTPSYCTRLCLYSNINNKIRYASHLQTPCTIARRSYALVERIVPKRTTKVQPNASHGHKKSMQNKPTTASSTAKPISTTRGTRGEQRTKERKPSPPTKPSNTTAATTSTTRMARSSNASGKKKPKEKIVRNFERKDTQTKGNGGRAKKMDPNNAVINNQKNLLLKIHRQKQREILQQQQGKRRAKQQPKVARERVKVTIIPNSTTPLSLSAQLSVRTVDVLKFMIKNGATPRTASDVVDTDVAELVVDHFGGIPHIEEKGVANHLLERRPLPSMEERQTLPHKPAVVCILGHIDHGKTSLLDAFRETNVTATEAGGITQGVTSFGTTLKSTDTKMSFIDTPGHVAFEKMRESGCAIADMAILVVSAAAGVQEQTIDAIRVILASDAPYVVALNKCDLPSAEPSKVELELTRHGVQTESLGGDVPCVHISCETGEGLEDLQVVLSALAEIEDLRATRDPHTAEAVVLESTVDRGLGPVSTCIVRRGTLEIGQHIVCGGVFGRIKALLSTSTGQNVQSVSAGEPVMIVGLKELVSTSTDVLVCESFEAARMSAEAFADVVNRQAQTQHAIDVEQFELVAAKEAIEEKIEFLNKKDADRDEENEEEAQKEVLPSIRFIVKADSVGALEVIQERLQSFPHDQISFHVIKANVGTISTADVDLAQTADAVLVSYGVSITNSIKRSIEKANVEIVSHPIIYTLIDRILESAQARLPVTRVRRDCGKATVLQVFKLSAGSRHEQTVAGCAVNSGKLERNALLDVMRGNVLVKSGVKLTSLRHLKDVVKEVRSGMECGVITSEFNEYEQDDVFQCYVINEEKTLLKINA